MQRLLNILTPGLLAALVFLAGCNSSTRIDEYRQAPATIMNAEESVVILGRRHSSGHETEIDFVACVGQSLAGGNDGMSVIPEQEFVDAMYALNLEWASLPGSPYGQPTHSATYPAGATNNVRGTAERAVSRANWVAV